jgi:PLP dependent protein
VSLELDIAHNISLIRERIGAAASRAGRLPGDITLVAVSKTFGADSVRAAYAAGQRDFGENKVQEAERKIASTPGLDGVRWHLIGHLQSNKARKAAAPFAMIHSVDSLDLLRRLDGAASEAGAAPQILLQADLAGEATKHGTSEHAILALARSALESRAAKLAGLMLLPPWNENQEVTRPWFVKLRQLRERLAAEGIPSESLRHLSMGMSHDFEAAVEEGATLVRVGTAIFGRRTTI